MKPFDIVSLLGTPDMLIYLGQVQQAMAKALATDNPSLQKPLERLIHARSKRLRSMLTIAVAHSQGKNVNDTVIDGCAAIELVHIGSLVHDDIIDNAATRWSVPTVNSQEGTDQAILVGDYLFAKAGVIAATISADAALLISSTIAALVDGESREVADEHNADRSVESLLSSISGKTAALISAACQMGGLCAKLPREEVDALALYGESFGMAFQLVDDILDFLSTPEIMGKPTGNDINEGVYTLPVLLALSGPHGEEVRSLIQGKEAPRHALIQILLESGAIKETIQEAKKYNQSAADALDNLHGLAELANLPDKYLKWALANLVDERYQKFL